DSSLRRPALEHVELLQRLLHLAFGADDPYEALHHFLQRALNRVRILAARLPVLERRQRRRARVPDLRRVDRAARVLADELRSLLTGALAEHEQVRQGIAAEAVRAVDARCALPRRE